MRDKRLLSLAVVAVALGFAAPAMADIAVATLIIDPNGAPNTWESKIRLWSDLGPDTAPSGLGFMDFVLLEVAGTVPLGKAVTISTNQAPRGAIRPIAGGTEIETGFHRMRRDGGETGGPGYGIMAVQPVSYATLDTYTGDANVHEGAVLPGIGVMSSADANWQPPAGYEIVGAAPTWKADTLIAKGSYTNGSGAGTLTLNTAGVLSFSVLEEGADGNWHGPADDQGQPVTDLKPWVSAVVTQVMTGGTGNNGGTFFDRATAMTVEEGKLILPGNTGSAATSGSAAIPYVSLSIAGRPDTSVQLSSNQDLVGLSINYAAAGLQGLDLNSPAISGAANMVRIYPALNDDASRAAVEAELLAAILHAVTTGTDDGIFDSGLHPNSVIAVTDRARDLNDDLYVLMRPTREGDADCSGQTDFDDLLVVAANWGGSNTTWDQGNLNWLAGSTLTDFDDLLIVAANWGGSYSPEPGTLAVLTVGMVGVLVRRRRR